MGETRDQILALLRQYRLPTETGLDPEILLRLALGDKKRRGSRLALVVPQSMGDCILHDIPLEELPRWIAAGYRRPAHGPDFYTPVPCRYCGSHPLKSWAHRLLLGAALSGEPTPAFLWPPLRDIQATMSCLSALGAELTYQSDTVLVHPGRLPGCCRLPCGESGSTLRLLLPVVAALGIHAGFFHGGAASFPPSGPPGPGAEAHGVRLSRPEPGLLQCRGKLEPGSFRLPGNVSSQFISGLLFALPLLDRKAPSQ